MVLAPSASQQIGVEVRDLADLVIASPQVSFTSSAPSVLTVSTTGLVTAVGAGGSGSVKVRVDTLEQAVGVYIGTSVPVAVTHTTLTGASMYEADIGPGGQLVVSAPEAGLVLRGTLPGSTLPTSFSVGASPLGVAVNHAGTRAYVAVAQGVKVLDLGNNTVLTTITVDGGGAKVGMVVSTDDQRAYLGTNVYIYVIDLAANAVIDSLDVQNGFFLALHPTQPLLYAGEGLPREINLTTRQVRTFSGAGVKDLAVSSDGTELFGADEGGGALRVFSIGSGQLTQSLPVPGAFGLAASPKYIVVAGGGKAAIFDRASRVPITTLSVGGIPRRPAINGAENTIAVPNEGGWVDYIQ